MTNIVQPDGRRPYVRHNRDGTSSACRWLSLLIEVGALVGLTTVILVPLYGQSRIFATMANDGSLPPVFARIGAGVHRGHPPAARRAQHVAAVSRALGSVAADARHPFLPAARHLDRIGWVIYFHYGRFQSRLRTM